MRKSVLSVLLTYMISISIHEKDDKLKGKQGKKCFAHTHSTTTTKNEESQPQVDFGLEAPENF